MKIIILNYPVIFFISYLLLLLVLFSVEEPITLLETVIGQISETAEVKKDLKEGYYQDGNYTFKVNNGNTRVGCEMCSKLTKTLRHQWRRSVVYIVNFEHILHFHC